MGKGRAPCCDKTKVKRGPWSPEEDMKLISFINQFGHDNWRSLPKQAGLLRCGKSCRLRWINYLRPDVKRGNFTAEEEDMIIKLHKDFGNKWSKIASQLPGRTDNEIKNVWHTHLKKRLIESSSRTDVPVDESISPCLSDKVEEEEGSLRKICQEFSTSMSSSGGSNNLNQEDDLQIGLTFEYIEAYNTEFTDIIQEVDKPELLEIPFDSDPEIWSFLESSKSFTAYENSSGSRVEEESDEDEVKKWFKHLESELGLEEDDDNNQQHKQETRDEEEESSLLKTYELMIH